MANVDEDSGLAKVIEPKEENVQEKQAKSATENEQKKKGEKKKNVAEIRDARPENKKVLTGSDLKVLNEERQEKKNCDLELKIEDRYFSVHRFVVCAFCPSLQNLKLSDKDSEPGTQTATIDFVSARAFTYMLEMIYSGSTHFPYDELPEVFKASKILQFIEVQVKCNEYSYLATEIGVCQTLEVYMHLHEATRIAKIRRVQELTERLLKRKSLTDSNAGVEKKSQRVVHKKKGTRKKSCAKISRVSSLRDICKKKADDASRENADPMNSSTSGATLIPASSLPDPLSSTEHSCDSSEDTQSASEQDDDDDLQVVESPEQEAVDVILIDEDNENESKLNPVSGTFDSNDECSEPSTQEYSLTTIKQENDEAVGACPVSDNGSLSHFTSLKVKVEKDDIDSAEQTVTVKEEPPDKGYEVVWSVDLDSLKQEEEKASNTGSLEAVSLDEGVHVKNEPCKTELCKTELHETELGNGELCEKTGLFLTRDSSGNINISFPWPDETCDMPSPDEAKQKENALPSTNKPCVDLETAQINQPPTQSFSTQTMLHEEEEPLPPVLPKRHFEILPKRHSQSLLKKRHGVLSKQCPEVSLTKSQNIGKNFPGKKVKIVSVPPNISQRDLIKSLLTMGKEIGAKIKIFATSPLPKSKTDLQKLVTDIGEKSKSKNSSTKTSIISTYLGQKTSSNSMTFNTDESNSPKIGLPRVAYLDKSPPFSTSTHDPAKNLHSVGKDNTSKIGFPRVAFPDTSSTFSISVPYSTNSVYGMETTITVRPSKPLTGEHSKASESTKPKISPVDQFSTLRRYLLASDALPCLSTLATIGSYQQHTTTLPTYVTSIGSSSDTQITASNINCQNSPGISLQDQIALKNDVSVNAAEDINGCNQPKPIIIASSAIKSEPMTDLNSLRQTTDNSEQTSSSGDGYPLLIVSDSSSKHTATHSDPQLDNLKKEFPEYSDLVGEGSDYKIIINRMDDGKDDVENISELLCGEISSDGTVKLERTEDNVHDDTSQVQPDDAESTDTSTGSSDRPKQGDVYLVPVYHNDDPHRARSPKLYFQIPTGEDGSLITKIKSVSDEPTTESEETPKEEDLPPVKTLKKPISSPSTAYPVMLVNNLNVAPRSSTPRIPSFVRPEMNVPQVVVMQNSSKILPAAIRKRRPMNPNSYSSMQTVPRILPSPEILAQVKEKQLNLHYYEPRNVVYVKPTKPVVNTGPLKPTYCDQPLNVEESLSGKTDEEKVIDTNKNEPSEKDEEKVNKDIVNEPVVVLTTTTSCDAAGNKRQAVRCRSRKRKTEEALEDEPIMVVSNKESSDSANNVQTVISKKRKSQKANTTEGLYSCEKCINSNRTNGMFHATLADLLKHYDLCHNGSTIYNCKICDFGYTEYGFYVRHLRCRHKEAYSPHICQVCGDMFKSDDDRLHHIDEAHKVQQKV